MAQSADDVSSNEPEKSERIVTYVTPESKSAVEAASGEMSVASWVREAIDGKLKNAHQEAVVENTNAEERIEALIAEARDEIADATAEYHDLLAVNGVYSVAAFRLLGDFGDFSDLQRKTALEAGSETLQRYPLDFDLDTGSTAESDTRASESQQGSNISPPDSLDDSDDDNDLDDLL
jgi:hypothetical protein